MRSNVVQRSKPKPNSPWRVMTRLLVCQPAIVSARSASILSSDVSFARCDTSWIAIQVGSRAAMLSQRFEGFEVDREGTSLVELGAFFFVLCPSVVSGHQSVNRSYRSNRSYYH